MRTYMVIERFRGGNAAPVYARYRERGGTAPRTYEPGKRTLELRYPTRWLYESGDTGAFVLDTLRLFKERGGFLYAGLEERRKAYRTRAYTRGEFQHEKILLNGEVDAHPVDTNGNGKFDLLVVEVGIDIDFAGDYSWQGMLANRNEFAQGWIASGSERGRLPRGSNRLKLTFPSGCIARSVDGRGYWLSVFDVYPLGLPGDDPPGAPKYAFTHSDPIPLPPLPPPSAFEPSKVERVETAHGFYHCR